MDEEARLALIAQATAQHARAEIKRARANIPVGAVLITMGLVIGFGAAMLPLGLIGKVLIAGIGFVFVPGGMAVLIRAAGTISRANRQLRDVGLPAARLISR